MEIRLADEAARNRPVGSAKGRFAIALAGALFLHGLIGFLLWRAQEKIASGKANHPPLTIDLHFAPAKPKTPAAPTAPILVAPTAVPPPANATAQSSAKAANAPRVKANPKLENSAAANRTDPNQLPAALRPHDEAWARSEGLGPSRAPGSSGVIITKNLRDPLAALGVSRDAGRGDAGRWNNGYGEGPQGPVRVPTKEEALAEEQARVTLWVQNGLVDELALARARDVRDGYWQDVQDVLEKGFEPEWSLLDAPGKRTPAPSAMQQIAGDYMKAASNYGKTGSPFSGGTANGAPAPGATGASLNKDLAGSLSADRGLRGTDLDNHIEVVRQIQNSGSGDDTPFFKRLVAHVMLTQGADGTLDEVSLAGSSGNPVYDALVLGQARKLSLHGLLGAPPKSRRRTLWAFEADFVQTPPMPVAGCQLSSLFMPQDCFYPFKQSVKSKVNLEAVY